MGCAQEAASRLLSDRDEREGLQGGGRPEGLNAATEATVGGVATERMQRGKAVVMMLREETMRVTARFCFLFFCSLSVLCRAAHGEGTLV